MRRKTFTAAALTAGAAGAIVMWGASGPMTLDDRPGGSLQRADEKHTAIQARGIKHSAEWAVCAARLDAGDSALQYEMARMQTSLHVTESAARQSVLVVCANDLVTIRRDTYRR